MNKGLTKIILAILLLLPLCANATIVKDFNENGTIQDGDYYDEVNIWDNTIVDMIGGKVAGGNIYNTAILNYTGGEMGYFIAFDNATVNVHSGYETSFELTDYGKVHLHNGGSDFQVLIISNNVQLHIYGYDLAFFNGNGGPYLEGRWEDSLQDFRIGVRYAGGVNLQDVIFLHEVPEPCSTLIFSFLVFLARLKRKNI